jgi:hypothetical protein
VSLLGYLEDRLAVALVPIAMIVLLFRRARIQMVLRQNKSLDLPMVQSRKRLLLTRGLSLDAGRLSINAESLSPHLSDLE